MADEPAYWYKQQGPFAWILSPFSWLYGSVARGRMQKPPRYVSPLPVLCIGNLTAGGAGKTPTAMEMARIAKAKKLKPGFLTRGYGSAVRSEPLHVNPRSHNSQDVGDEPLLLATRAPTVACADRVAGAKLLETLKVDFIIMDDGFQNAALHKDYNLVVVDTDRGIGNGYVHPAGPLRAPLRAQLARADALLLVGTSRGAGKIMRVAARMAKPVLAAATKVPRPGRWKGVKVFAFCGIGMPQKFYQSLQDVGAEVVETRSFPDHHVYSATDCQELLDRAGELDALPATTTKDKARLMRRGEKQAALHEAAQPLEIKMQFENDKRAEAIIDETLKRVRDRRAREMKLDHQDAI